MKRAVVLATLIALAGCGSGSQAPTPAATPSLAASPAPSAPSEASAPTAAVPTASANAVTTQDLKALDSRDCRTVAMAYVEAVARNDFAYAARVWNDPTIDAARLKARFAGYATPRIEITRLQEEGAAGSLYCTVTGMLTDVADAGKAPKNGEIVLRRVNDVPGATAEQLRWTIRSSTFVEKRAPSGKSGAT